MDKAKVLLVSLGCDKNTADSEAMLGILKQAGFDITVSEEDADIEIINTCCFINDAKEESIETIIEAAENKKAGIIKGIIVTGCLAERYKEEILKEIPEVDAIIGTTAYDLVADAAEAIMNNKSDNKSFFRDINYLPLPESERLISTGGYYAYLKIAEGCDKHCTYCIIPKVRGSYRSIPMDRLVKEAEQLAETGVKELIVVAQETTVYGKDLYGKKMLAELVHKLCAIDGIKWVRLLYCYPEEIDDEFIEMLKNEPKLCKYLDIPVQHASDKILKQMGRRTRCEEIKGLISRMRKEVPGLVLRTSLITGFPGETEEDFEELKEFVKTVRFERLGCFTYSKEENTPAATYKNQVPKRVKLQRRKHIMELQQEIVFENAGENVGREFEVIIEGYLPEEEIYIGRTYMDAPNVDGYVFVKSEDSLMSGDMVKVLVTEAEGYDLIGDKITTIGGNDEFTK